MWCPMLPDCEWIATMAPPSPSTSSAKALGVQVLVALIFEGVRLGHGLPNEALDITGSAENMIDVGRSFAELGQRGYVVPRPHPTLVTRRVLVMERLSGFAFDARPTRHRSCFAGFPAGTTIRSACGVPGATM